MTVKVPQSTIEIFITEKIEPVLENFIDDELLVYYDSAKSNYFRVDAVSKTIMEPNLFGGENTEFLFHRAPLYKSGIVKRRDPYFVRLECKFRGFKFFLDFHIVNPVQETQ